MNHAAGSHVGSAQSSVSGPGVSLSLLAKRIEGGRAVLSFLFVLIRAENRRTHSTLTNLGCCRFTDHAGFSLTKHQTKLAPSHHRHCPR